MHRFETNNTTYLIKDEDLAEEVNINEPFWGNDWDFTEHKGPVVYVCDIEGTVVYTHSIVLDDPRMDQFLVKFI